MKPYSLTSIIQLKNEEYMLRKVFLYLLLATFTISLNACESKNESNNEFDNSNYLEADNIKSDSKKAPDFNLPTVEGKSLKLSDFKGKIVIVDFWATWCPPCRKGIPDLIEIQNEFKNDVVIIGISLDRETKKDVPAFIKNYKINYPVVYGNSEVAQSYGGVSAIPTAFIIDKKGNIVDMHVGLMPKSTYVSKIKQLLGK
jgi:cytochrome c biogenesis protein CcmG/thiol:disulfide interchange protein DsbE